MHYLLLPLLAIDESMKIMLRENIRYNKENRFLLSAKGKYLRYD
jgi:hypothetical protein